HAGDQLVDKAVLRPAQGGDIEPRDGQEIARIGRATVRRVEQHRALAFGRVQDLERWIKLVAEFTHGWPFQASVVSRWGGSSRTPNNALLSMRRGVMPSYAFGSRVIYLA